ncbi:MAG TPA: ABC transporter substrate-binding protein [Stellaceae bacterium]|nr:ABC transporter substrate-binding protein [Stellaceae bacterium]
MTARRILFALFVLLLAGERSAAAADSLSIAVGGANIVAYLPLTIANELGYFKAAGIDVTINDVQSGTKMAEALVGGSADIGFGSYEHVIHLRPKGLDVVCIMLINHTYGAVIGLTKEHAATYKSPADLKAYRMGVIAPGSALDVALQLLIAKAGLSHDDVASVGVGAGAGAIAAMKSGRLDGISHADPVISRLIQDGDIVPIVDTRTEAGIKYLYNGLFAGSAVLSKESVTKEHAQAVQVFMTQIIRAFRFIKTAPIDQVMALVPPAYYGPDKDIYQRTLTSNRTSEGVFTVDGATDEASARTTLHDLATFDPLLKGKEGAFNIGASYDNRFVEAANRTLDAAK